MDSFHTFPDTILFQRKLFKSLHIHYTTSTKQPAQFFLTNKLNKLGMILWQALHTNTSNLLGRKIDHIRDHHFNPLELLEPNLRLSLALRNITSLTTQYALLVMKTSSLNLPQINLSLCTPQHKRISLITSTTSS